MSTKGSRDFNFQNKITGALPPVIYLDSQDYSRFGDVLRGKSNESTEKLFRFLEDRKQAGDVIFAVSFPVLSEVLQYDSNFRETALKKAEAIERLCGGWALAFPSRLVAAEVATVAHRLNLTSELPYPAILSADRYWYPYAADCFEDLNARLQEILKNELRSFGILSRNQRRLIIKKVYRTGIDKLAESAAPAISKEYGIPIDSIIDSIVKFLRGEITAQEASRKLFSNIAEPVKFVELYFEKIASDDSLPKWIRNVGDSVASAAIEFRDEILRFDLNKNEMEELIKNHHDTFGQSILTLAHDSANEFQIEEFLNEKFLKNPSFITQIPSFNVIGTATATYLGQIIGIYGNKFKV